MLLNTNKEFIIWTPYKNYSTSMHRYFRPKNGWIVAFGGHTLMPDMFGPHTNNYSGPNNPELKRILPVRNPFDRVISMWKFNQRHNDTPIDFTRWFNRVGMTPLNGPVASQYGHDEIVRCEFLQEDLEKLGIVIKDFPWENKSKEFNVTLTEKQKDIIRWFHRVDFEAGSYSTDTQ